MQLIPCVVLSLLIHPTTQHHLINRICWSFCVFLEAVSVLPQLRVMQNTKVCWGVECGCLLPSFFFFSLGDGALPLSRSQIAKVTLMVMQIFCATNVPLNLYLFIDGVFIRRWPTSAHLPFVWFQIVEPFTAHYIFALGVARFLSCAHWVLQVW